MNKKTIFDYFVDVLLAISFLLVAVTGIISSAEIKTE